MEKEQVELNILFRNPRYPVIIISRDRLLSGGSRKTAALYLLNSTLQEGKKYISVIDSSGEEFWYRPDLAILSPGFTFKKWTKRRIIDLFNESLNSRKMKATYPVKSLSKKKLSEVIRDICGLIKSHNNG